MNIHYSWPSEHIVFMGVVFRGGGGPKVGGASMQMHLPHNFRRNGGPLTKRRKCRFLTAYVFVCEYLCVPCAHVCVCVHWREDNNIRHDRIFGIVCWCQCKDTPHFAHFSIRLHLGLQFNWKFSYVQLCACVVAMRLSVCECTRRPH